MNLHLLSLYFLLWFRLSKSQSIAAFYSEKGPTIVTLDQTSGNLSYNTLTENGYSSWQDLPFKNKPRIDSAIACVGYNLSLSIWGSLFYQLPNSSLSLVIFKCASASGICINLDESVISTGVSVPVHPETRLSAILLERNLGYRVTYQDVNGSIRQLSYANSTKGVVTYWADGAFVANFTDVKALSTVFVPATNGTLPQQTIYPLAGGEIHAMTENSLYNISQANHTWASGPIISNLTSWNPANTTYASIIYGDWYCLFYIDTTRHVQFLRSVDFGITWQPEPGMNESVWPLADEANAPIAAASSVNNSASSASIFYTSGGKLVQSTIKKYSWTPISIVQPPIVSKTEVNATASSIPNPYQDRNKSEIKIKIKIGSSIGSVVAFIVVSVVVVWCIRRKKNAGLIEDPEKMEESENEQSYGGKAELHAESHIIHELDHDPECLLLHQLQLIRMHELQGAIPLELENLEARRPELDGLCKCELEGFVGHELPSDGDKDTDESSREGKEEETTVSVKELADWTWLNLKKEERGDLEIGARSDEEKNSKSEEVDSE